MSIDCVTNADHRICKVDKPGLGTERFHITRNLHNRTDIARGMCEAARAAILRLRLTHPIFERDLVILFPQILPRADLDRIDDELRACKRLGMIRMGCNVQL